jgi:hypothetical protein
VIAISEHRAAATPRTDREHSVHMPAGRDREALHAARKRKLVLRLDEHVHVRPLDADVHDPDPLAERCRDRRLAHRLVQRPPPHVPDRGDDPQDDVQRKLRLHQRPLLVPRARAAALRFATRSLALATAPEQLLLYVPLARSPRSRRPCHACLIVSLAATVNGET